MSAQPDFSVHYDDEELATFTTADWRSTMVDQLRFDAAALRPSKFLQYTPLCVLLLVLADVLRRVAPSVLPGTPQGFISLVMVAVILYPVVAFARQVRPLTLFTSPVALARHFNIEGQDRYGQSASPDAETAQAALRHYFGLKKPSGKKNKKASKPDQFKVVFAAAQEANRLRRAMWISVSIMVLALIGAHGALLYTTYLVAFGFAIALTARYRTVALRPAHKLIAIDKMLSDDKKEEPKDSDTDDNADNYRIPESILGTAVFTFDATPVLPAIYELAWRWYNRERLTAFENMTLRGYFNEKVPPLNKIRPMTEMEVEYTRDEGHTPEPTAAVTTNSTELPAGSVPSQALAATPEPSAQQETLDLVKFRTQGTPEYDDLKELWHKFASDPEGTSECERAVLAQFFGENALQAAATGNGPAPMPEFLRMGDGSATPEPAVQPVTSVSAATPEPAAEPINPINELIGRAIVGDLSLTPQEMGKVVAALLGRAQAGTITAAEQRLLDSFNA